ncbi:hypothetical protein [Pseudohongiella spirulinae]|uniref:Type IV pilus biogenesis protein PilP n=1 Tax=Pseudohongiella spirulinae TaxID=1249552 RepID=A0A0S2KAQ3_9GAMM|nr:hypothetical protein [Pseudohongiella spirulinae]ALO45370.1 hypothetical protein PS2015_690 [Pseudohongiella spirulinae]
MSIRYCFLSTLLISAISTTSATAQTASLGRFFSTPSERAALDALRDELLQEIRLEELSSIQLIGGSDDDFVPLPPDMELYLSGTLRHGNGQHTIWLNGEAVAESDLPDGYSLVTTGMVTSLRIAGNRGVFTLRPGQVLRLMDGSITEQAFVPPPANATRTNQSTRPAVGVQTQAPDAVEIDSIDGNLGGIMSMLETLRMLQENL